MKLRVLLVRPPRRGHGDASLSVPPLGLAMVAASLRDEGHGVHVLDGLLGESIHSIRRVVAEERPDVVGISVLSPVLDVAARVVSEVRPHVRWIVVGGPHPSAVETGIFNDLPEVDLSVVGEGEFTTPEALEWLVGGGDGDPPPGVAARGRRFRKREYIEDLSRLPRPAWDLLPLKRYRHPLATHRRIATMVSSRGCPGTCVFCDHSVHGYRWRARSARDVVAEAVWLRRRWDVRHVLFYDDDFLHDRQRALDIADGLVREGVPVEWRCEARVDGVDPPLLVRLREAGCRMMAFGLESAHSPTLRALGKGFTVEQAVLAFEAAHRAGIRTVAYVILGAPGEGVDEVRRTVDLCHRLRADYAQFSTLTIMQGTPLAREYGPIETGGKNPFDADCRRPVASDLSPEVLGSLMGESWRRFYLRPGPMVRLVRDLGRSGSLELVARIAVSRLL